MKRICYSIFVLFQIDRESLTLPVGGSQFYTTSLSPISSTPPLEKEPIAVASSTPTSTAAPVVELTEEVTIYL